VLLGQLVEPVQQFAQRVPGRDGLAGGLGNARLPGAELAGADDHVRVLLAEPG